MKLRIKGNSLRLRVTRPELAALVEGGRVEESIRFGPGPADRLAYVLQVGTASDGDDRDDGYASPLVAFAANEVRVTLSPAAVRRWREPDRVAVEGRLPVGGGEVLHVLVEKDFACVDGPPGGEDPDAFPNPSAGRAC
ncbi:MAG: hypothetical protein JWO31_1587 [Phycisphaerales bacterium]|nr:hypothetical protein [Phycisphaerales bacterium]